MNIAMVPRAERSADETSVHVSVCSWSATRVYGIYSYETRPQKQPHGRPIFQQPTTKRHVRQHAAIIFGCRPRIKRIPPPRLQRVAIDGPRKRRRNSFVHQRRVVNTTRQSIPNEKSDVIVFAHNKISATAERTQQHDNLPSNTPHDAQSPHGRQRISTGR